MNIRTGLAIIFLLGLSQNISADYPAIEEISKCASVDECVVGLDPCGKEMGINKKYLQEAIRWSNETPWHCRSAALFDNSSTHIACINSRCEVFSITESHNIRELRPEDIRSHEFTPYILK